MHLRRLVGGNAGPTTSPHVDPGACGACFVIRNGVLRTASRPTMSDTASNPGHRLHRSASEPTLDSLYNRRMIQRTLAIIKPDAVERKNVGKILARIEQEGFRVRAMRTVHLG